MQISKYQKKIQNLPISQNNKRLLLQSNFKYAGNANYTNSLKFKFQPNVLSLYQKNKNNQKQVSYQNNLLWNAQRSVVQKDMENFSNNYESNSQENSNNNQSQRQRIYDGQNLSQTFTKVQQNQNDHVFLVQSLHKGKKKHCVNQNILKICNKGLIICSNIVKQGNLKEAEVILNSISETLSDFGIKSETYRWKLTKIKTTIIKAQLILAKIKHNYLITKKQSEFILRFPLFCFQLQKDVKYYLILSGDYYSFIEAIYIIAIKSFSIEKSIYKKLNESFLHQKKYVQCNYQISRNIVKNKKKILQLIQNCRMCLSKQLQKLCGIIAQIHDKKLFLIIKSKSEILLKLYGLELAMMYIQGIYQKAQKKKQQKQQRNSPFSQIQFQNDGQNLRQQVLKIKKKIWSKYQNLFKIVPNCLDSNQIQDEILKFFVNSIKEISSVNTQIKNVETQNYLKVNETKINIVFQERGQQGNLFHEVCKSNELDTVLQKQKENQQRYNDNFSESQIQKQKKPIRLYQSCERHKIELSNKPRVVICEPITKNLNTYKKLLINDRDPKLPRPSILIKHNLIGQDSKSEISANPITKTDFILKFEHGSEGKNKKKVVIIENQQHSLTTPKVGSIKNQISPRHMNLQKQHLNLQRKQKKKIIRQKKNLISHHQSSVSVSNIMINRKSMEQKTKNPKQIPFISSLNQRKTINKDRKSERKSATKSQVQKNVKQKFIGKRIYEMSVFKMAIADPFREKNKTIKISFEPKDSDYTPFQKVKRTKSLNSCQKFITVIPGLLNTMEKKKYLKKLVLNKKIQQEQ